MTILNRHEKSYCKRNFIKIYQLGSNILFLWKRSSTGIFRLFRIYFTKVFSTPSNVQLNELDPYFRPFHAAYHEFLAALRAHARGARNLHRNRRAGPSTSVAWAILMAGKGRRYTKVFVALLHLSPPRAKGYRKNAA